jgi:putrescine transport system permease protein
MKSKPSKLILFLGYLFLYFPLICIVIYSFNESRFVSVWSGFSLKWYESLFSDPLILRATVNSIKIASFSATIAVIIGTIAAIVIVKFDKFNGKSLFVSVIAAPMIMPEVIMGLSLLMLFISMEKIFGWPNGRGTITVTIAHITLTVSYVTMIVQARLQGFDKSLEEAALDLGASPLKVFFVITLPIIFPGIISGWLLAFALSLDDVVIASFVSGPGATTLPMIVFSSLKFGISPKVNALATILMSILSIGVIVAAVSMRRKNKLRFKRG